MEINLAEPGVLSDPFAAYGEARELTRLVHLAAPGFGGMWAVTRYEDAKALLTDPRVGLSDASYLPAEIPDHCRRYMRTMQQLEGDEHARIRRLVWPGFTPRRAQEFRPRIDAIVERLLTALEGDTVDLVTRFAQPLPIDVITELLDIPHERRPAWREYGKAVAAGHGQAFYAAIPEIIDDARLAVERGAFAELGGDGKLTTTDLVTLVWHLVLAGQTPALLVANAVEALLTHPDQLDLLRADPALLPGAVEELTRWAGPQLLTLPRHTREEAEIAGTVVPAGEAVVVALAAVNRDPRAFADPDRLDLTRAGGNQHLGYAYGPHFCLGAAFARAQTEAAIGGLLRRFPGLALVGAQRHPDPGAWRLHELVVRL